MISGIPEFSYFVASQNELIERCYLKSWKGTELSVKIILLHNTGYDTFQEDFERAKEALDNIAILAYQDGSKIICLFSDASKQSYAIVPISNSS